MSLAARHALVCGASAGIGRAAALAIASLGAEVTVLARRRPQLESLLPELQAAGAPQARCVEADMEDLPGLESAVSHLLAQHGPVHVLVHNTGGPAGGPLLDAGDAAILRAIQRILLSAQLLVRLVLPGMRQTGFGRIVNVLSISVREPVSNLGVGNTVRGAMAGWAKTLSNELPPGITINNVLPGYTATERLREVAEAAARRTGRTTEEVLAGYVSDTPEHRLAEPHEIAAAVAFLASPAASYIRGVNLAVDGGRMRGI
jgi:3-oxoacyl-[acyl-carrier protein] reductase